MGLGQDWLSLCLPKSASFFCSLGTSGLCQTSATQWLACQMARPCWRVIGSTVTGGQGLHAPMASPLSGWRRPVAAAGPAPVSLLLHQPGWCYRDSAFSMALQRGRPEGPFPPHYMQNAPFTHVPSPLCPLDVFSFSPRDHCSPVSLEALPQIMHNQKENWFSEVSAQPGCWQVSLLESMLEKCSSESDAPENCPLTPRAVWELGAVVRHHSGLV